MSSHSLFKVLNKRHFDILQWHDLHTHGHTKMEIVVSIEQIWCAGHTTVYYGASSVIDCLSLMMTTV